MVTTSIDGAKLEVWADASSEDALFNLVTSELDESADEICVVRAVLDKPSNYDFRFQLVFDVWTDGLFVGDVVAEDIEESLREVSEHPTVSYTRLEEEEDNE